MFFYVVTILWNDVTITFFASSDKYLARIISDLIPCDTVAFRDFARGERRHSIQGLTATGMAQSPRRYIGGAPQWPATKIEISTNN